MPAKAQLTNSITIFVSYAPQDSDILEQLEGHLSTLKPLITLWYDRKMEPGSNRKEEIERQLDAAQIILFLISKDFLASDDCQQQVERAMGQLKQQERVIPILARACNWKNTPYGNLQSLPGDEKPLGSRPRKDRDSALAAIAASLQNRIQQTSHHHIPKKHRSLRAKPLYPHPEIILQREEIVKEIYERLTGDNITALVLTGMVGIGKTTLSALVCEHAKKERENGKGPFTEEELWLKIEPTTTLLDLIGTLSEAMNVHSPSSEPMSLTDRELAERLFDILTTADGRRLIILDQFEEWLDIQTGHHMSSDYPDISEWLDLLNNQQCTSRILLTSRSYPRGISHICYMQEYPIQNLQIIEGVRLLQILGVEAEEKEMSSAVTHCCGYPPALVLMRPTLNRDRSLNIADLLSNPIHRQRWISGLDRWLGNYIEKLSQVQCELLFAFSIYREEVPFKAAQLIVNPRLRTLEVELWRAFDVLLEEHLFTKTEHSCYALHPSVADFVRSRYLYEVERISKAHETAAHYYQHQADLDDLPRNRRRQVEQIHHLIEAIWHHTQAGQQQVAYAMIHQKGIFSDLLLWNEHTILLELYKQLFPTDTWQEDTMQAASIHKEMGEIYKALGQVKEAERYWKEALILFKSISIYREVFTAFKNLEDISRLLGDEEQAGVYHEEADRIKRERIPSSDLNEPPIILNKWQDAQPHPLEESLLSSAGTFEQQEAAGLFFEKDDLEALQKAERDGSLMKVSLEGIRKLIATMARFGKILEQE